MSGTPVTERSTNAPSPTERHLSPGSRRSPGLFALVFEQARAEFLQNLRAPEFLVGTVAIPVLLFLMFGLPNANDTLPGGTRVSTLMMVSFGAYGVLSLAIFTFGVDVASERGRGWLTLMRATPLPAWVYFAGKLAMVALFGMLILLALFGTGYLLAGVRLPLGGWLATFGMLLAGALSFSTLGFALGYLARPKAASTVANLVYLPLSFASGFFFPLSELPQVVQRLAPYLPTYHYGQLAWRAVAAPGDAAAFVGWSGGSVLEHSLWLLGCFTTFGLLAVWGYRRDQTERLR